MKKTNEEITEVLEQIARLLEAQNANPFRVNAYRNAADEVRSRDESVAEMVFTEGEDALQAMPDIGPNLAGLITEYVQEGRSSLLERLQSEVSPQAVLKQVPGIGDELSQRIVDTLAVTTLPELEEAAHDGRLAEVPGFGEERVRSVKMTLAGVLSRSAQRHARRVEQRAPSDVDEPSVELLLEIDKAYRERAAAGELETIAPKRFNPNNEAWLPIMHEERGGWTFTVLYSNTAQAHRLNKIHDWVVIYYKQNGEEEQVTAVTETQGSLEGKRVIRGREDECREYYEEREA